MTALSFIGTEDEMIARTRDADALVVSSSPVAYFSSAAVAPVPRRCGEEVARVLTGQRPSTW
jgi:hypothetical protein